MSDAPPPDRPRAGATVPIRSQPDLTTCGQTALHAVYRYYGDTIELEQLLEQVSRVENGGTLGVHLANHALARGYRARLYTFNLQVLDPTWLTGGIDVAAKLRRQAELKADARIQEATPAYLEFLDRGGEILLEDLSPELLARHLGAHEPLLAGLSATFLYRWRREDPVTCEDDDEGGEMAGHFVVLTDLVPDSDRVHIADPLGDNPLGPGQVYEVPLVRLIGAIYLGVTTYDGNLIVIRPKEKP